MFLLYSWTPARYPMVISNLLCQLLKVVSQHELFSSLLSLLILVNPHMVLEYPAENRCIHWTSQVLCPCVEVFGRVKPGLFLLWQRAGLGLLNLIVWVFLPYERKHSNFFSFEVSFCIGQVLELNVPESVRIEKSCFCREQNLGCRGGHLNSSLVFHTCRLWCSRLGREFGGVCMAGFCLYVLSLDGGFLRSAHAYFLLTYTIFIVSM